MYMYVYVQSYMYMTVICTVIYVYVQSYMYMYVYERQNMHVLAFYASISAARYTSTYVAALYLYT